MVTIILPESMAYMIYFLLGMLNVNIVLQFYLWILKLRLNKLATPATSIKYVTPATSQSAGNNLDQGDSK